MRMQALLKAGVMAAMLAAGGMAVAQDAAAPAAPVQVKPTAAQPDRGLRGETFSADEIVQAGHKFFGTTTRGLARAVESVFRAHGRPTGYVLGEEASGGFVAGLRYGEGILYMKNGLRQKIFWQGPTIGFDAGGEGSKVLMLVYNLDTPRAIFGRWPGFNGSAYVVAGLGVSAYGDERIVLIPIRTGVGARLGVNIGYLKITARPTWNPF